VTAVSDPAEESSAAQDASAEASRPVHDNSEEAGVDIHKPKAAHNWREFVIEIATIICGILIALTLEQGIEWLHWNHALADAREGLVQDARESVRRAGLRDSQSVCLADAFDGIRATLDRAAETGRLPAVVGVNEPPRDSWTLNSYDAVVSGQTLLHMSARERLGATSMNGWSLWLQHNRDEEIRAWTVLRTLDGPGRRTSDVELTSLRAALSAAIYEEGVMRQGAWLFTQRIADAGILSRDEVAEAWKGGVARGRNRFACAAPGQGKNGTANLLDSLHKPLDPPPAPRPDWL
jgi:hypothetical protein